MPQGEIVIDPFTGQSMSRDALDALLVPYRRRGARSGLGDAPLGSFLQPARPREVIARMLRNLKEVFRSSQDAARLLAVAERLVILLPDAWEERRDRGLVHAALGARFRRWPTWPATWSTRPTLPIAPPSASVLPSSATTTLPGCTERSPARCSSRPRSGGSCSGPRSASPWAWSSGCSGRCSRRSRSARSSPTRSIRWSRSWRRTGVPRLLAVAVVEIGALIVAASPGAAGRADPVEGAAAAARPAAAAGRADQSRALALADADGHRLRRSTPPASRPTSSSTSTPTGTSRSPRR